jgi:2-(1,2-epoxy-1,2-dihydrophenyl)acetyl-CoA isomerase
MADELLVSNDGQVRTFTINRPDRHNALTPELTARLARDLNTAGTDDDLRMIVITGAAGNFSVGLDLRWIAQLGSDPAPSQLEDGMRDFQSVIHAVAETPVPVVAAIQGNVAGFGLDLALACDLRYADAGARFTSAFARMGLVPDGGSTSSLPALIGSSRAFRFLIDGSTISASEALSWGLVDSVSAEGELEETVAQLAAAIRPSARSSIATIKYLIDRHDSNGLADTLDAEGLAQLRALASNEFHQRLAAFVSK